VQRVESFVAYDTWIINERSIGRCSRRWHR
jgi:hypothetical protein